MDDKVSRDGHDLSGVHSLLLQPIPPGAHPSYHHAWYGEDATVILILAEEEDKEENAEEEEEEEEEEEQGK